MRRGTFGNPSFKRQGVLREAALTIRTGPKGLLHRTIVQAPGPAEAYAYRRSLHAALQQSCRDHHNAPADGRSRRYGLY
jgi:hypothetical protein